MNVKFFSGKSIRTKKMKALYPSLNPKKRNKSLHQKYNTEKENIELNIINNDIKIQKDNYYKKQIIKKDKDDLDFIFYKNISSDSFTDDFFSSLDNTFTFFNSINNINYLIFANKEKSIISYDLNNFQKITEIKNAHNKYITNYRHFYDKKNKRDLLISISAIDNNLKIWNIYNWQILLQIKNVNRSGVLFSACFLQYNNDLYIITTNSNLLKRKEPIKIFDMKANKIFEIKIEYSILFIDSYQDKISSKIFIIIGTQNNIISYDYTTKKIFNEYGDKKSSYYSIIVYKDYNNNTNLIASKFNGAIEIYDFYSGKEIKIIEFNEGQNFFGICLWNFNYILVACYDKTIKLIDIKEGKLKKCLYGHDNYITTVKKIYIPKYGDCLISQGITSDTIKLWILKK